MEAREARNRQRHREGVMQWEPGGGRRKAGSRDAGSEMSNARVGKLPQMVDRMGTRVAGEEGKMYI